MHDHKLWQTTATLAIASSAFCLTVACGGGNENQTGRSPAAATQSGQMPSQTQTTSSTAPGTAPGTYGQTEPTMGPTPPTQPTPPSQQAQPTAPTTPSPGTTTGGTMPSGAPGGDMANLSDEQIVAIVIAANTGEVQQAQLVKDRSHNAQVKKLAESIQADHQAISRDQQRLANKTKITPMQNQMSLQLSSDNKQALDTLRGKKGADFDREYIEIQIKEHRDLLDTLDNKLIPQAKNGELKSSLQNARSKVESHLRAAEDVQRGLGTKQ